MALSKTVLGALMHSKMDALSNEDKADRAKTFEALADAVIQHLTTAGVVTVNPAGLLAPPGTAGGPVTGAATGTIS
jgi:hypothetical protein